MQFNSVDAMLNHLKSAIKSSLKNEVAREVREAEQKAIENKVYNVYSPKIYSRRAHKEGGLIAESNITAEIIGDDILAVDNVAPINTSQDGWGDAAHELGISLAEAVISGRGYDYPGYPYANPRNFIQAAKDDLSSSGKIKTALNEGLRRQGFNCS